MLKNILNIFFKVFYKSPLASDLKIETRFQMIQFCFQEMSCEWIKQEPLEEDEIQFEAGPKQENPRDVLQSIKVEDGESSYKNEEALESDSHLKVILMLGHFSFSIIISCKPNGGTISYLSPHLLSGATSLGKVFRF